MSELCGCDPTFQRLEDLVDLQLSEGEEAGENVLPVSAALKGSTILGVETFFESKNHQRFYFLLNSGSLKSESDKIIGCTVTLTDITNRKKVENELIESERNLAASQEIAHTGSYSWDLENNKLTWSDELYRILGLKPKQISPSYDTYASLIHSDDKDEVVKNIKSIIEGGMTQPNEHRIVRSNGTVRSVQVKSKVLRENNGKPRVIYGTVQDITEYKEAEEARRKSENRYRMLFTNMTEGFGLVEVIYNSEGKPFDYRYLEINPAFELYFGMKRKQLLGKTMWETFPNVSSIALEKYEELVLSGQPVHFEIFSKVANKYLDNYAFTPEKGKVALILRDVTERKKAEDALQQAYEKLQIQSEELHASNEELQQQSEELQARTKELQDAYQALSESEKRYHLLFNHSLDAIILTDPRDVGKILSANPAACQMLGWPEEELIGKGRDSLFDPEDTVLSSLLNERANAGSARTQLTYRRKDGTKFIGELSTALFTDINGEPRAVAIIRDVTERNQMEEALRKSEEHYRTLFTI
jgi:PAS domain S-box-containing protein